jgi:Glycosyltransferase sugar-binding region containing DXD motif
VADLTGGRESRLILAVMLDAGVADRFTFRTRVPSDSNPSVMSVVGSVKTSPYLTTPSVELVQPDPKDSGHFRCGSSTIHVPPEGPTVHLIPSASMRVWPANRKAPNSRTNLMQFWDTPQAPPDVEELMASWPCDPHFIYYRYCWESARSFIEDRFDRRTLAVFEACAVPAMQSDVFRLCWLLEEGGIYIDADQGNRRRNESFTDRTARGHLFRNVPRHGHNNASSRDTAQATPDGDSDTVRICNGLMSFFERHDPLVGTLLEHVSANVERRIKGRVWGVTGPGVISTLFVMVGPHHPLFDNVRIHEAAERRHAVRIVRCDYTSSNTYWRNVTGSIYQTL